MPLNVKLAFILAGGKGERLKPLTNDTPKVMLAVKGKPILQWNIELCKKFGVQRIVLGVGHLHEKIQSFFGNGERFGVKIFYSIEKEFLGTAGALKEAEHYFKNEEKFIMMNGDEVKDINFLAMNELFEQKKALGVLSLIPILDVSQFGSVQLKGNQITQFLEKSVSPQNEKGLVSAGAYLLSSKVFDLIPANQTVSIEKQVFPQLAKNEKLFGWESQLQCFQTDDLERLEKARKEWKNPFHSSEKL
ncbi:nucleotidyltransferase family protein [Candidatus Micrarchaeota archaeon]|nr:nucleotidyltransferase family protein [Candidatus Micrarchaeota archaeon]MBU1930108.1 nucleotidyltransferase family protein [Candidatus Micrarchaeota archaeon]